MRRLLTLICIVRSIALLLHKYINKRCVCYVMRGHTKYIKHIVKSVHTYTAEYIVWVIACYFRSSRIISSVLVVVSHNFVYIYMDISSRDMLNILCSLEHFYCILSAVECGWKKIQRNTSAAALTTTENFRRHCNAIKILLFILMEWDWSLNVAYELQHKMRVY